jgi:superfamily I DNA/RNA helicase
VVAITFTEAAAGELKMRLRDALERLETASSDSPGSTRVIDLERANASTIHAFASACSRAPLRGRHRSVIQASSPTLPADVRRAWNGWIEKVTAGDEC